MSHISDFNSLVCAGIDIGGTNSEIGLVDREGNVVHRDTVSTPACASPEVLVQEAMKMIGEGLEKTKTKLAGIGIGAPSGNFYTGSIEHAPNLPWKGIIPLAKMFSDKANVKALLTNDANAAAIGEQLFGAAKGLRDFVVVTLGTGLGSGFVVNGEVLYGHSGFAGELGHVIIEHNGRPCGCGRKGCLETYVSATGIVATAKEWLEFEGEKTELKNIPAAQLTSKAISDAAAKGDLFALRLITFTAEKLGFALANMVAITSPSHIFLYGGLAKSGDLLLNPTKKSLDENILKNYEGTVKLQLSGLPDHAAVLGAAALVWKEVAR